MPLSLVVVVVYLIIFIAVLLNDQLLQKPNPRFNITQALSDLHHLTAHGPHPYNSHSNDLARNYILNRLIPIAHAHPNHVYIADDRVSNGSWMNARGTTGVYFEGTNILVKIDGLEEKERGGILFSAHYDSVSTAPGATDNGMGVATLLQLIQLFAVNRGKRTAIFNINNGEEDFLNGAHAFLQHPWSNITDTFLNLEGAASGGRPLVFRSSSLPPLRSFLPKHVPHPHANVLSADAFARGVIRSDTDYSIYTGLHAHSRPQKTMQGLDYAFYKHRSRYHTKYDAMPYMEGGKRALWSMLEGAAGAGRALVDVPLSLDSDVQEREERAVYFDLFASTLIIFPIHVLRIFNVVLLTVVPVGAVLLFVFVRLVRKRHIARHHDHPEHQSEIREILRRTWELIKSVQWTPIWFRFWGAFLLSIGTQAGLVVGYTKFNPYIMHSAPYLVLTTSFTLAYLTIYLPLTLTLFSPPSKPTPTTKQHLLTHLLIFAYLLLLVSTIFLPKDIGGTYLISAYTGCVFLGWVVGWVEGLVRAGTVRKEGGVEEQRGEEGEGEGEEQEEGREGERRPVRGVRFDLNGGEEPGNTSQSGDVGEVVEEPTEITPLLVQTGGTNRQRQGGRGEEEEEEAVRWWILEMLIIVPFPVILLSHILVMVVDGMGQSVIDGGPVWVVYALPFVLTLLITSLLIPFTHKIHRGVAYIFVLVFGLTIIYTWGLFSLWWGFPFSNEAPLKVYFQQNVQVLPLPLNPTINANVKLTTHLTSVPYYLERLVMPALPSAQTSSGVRCEGQGERVGLVTCVWESGDAMWPESGWSNTTKTVRIPRNPWFAGNVTRVSSETVRVVLGGRNTRNCRIYLDGLAAVGYIVRGGVGEGKMQDGYEVGEDGVKDVRLWSRTWGREWVVDVNFGGRAEGEGRIKGRVACEWAEYESATVGTGHEETRRKSGKIPALEEVLMFLPGWATITKLSDGLVEVWSPFEV
ncbi:hypothetical protein L208DRAFT_1359694 [Tricholoma matsutake]|nr:hypothetical protein L208DRAFT_1359694 [Tricholoma matsutake 945]